ncbi:MAG: prepilin-type N-terminal cleavage/methylation domain-containing protein [Candidatus Omnitrophota bacterium]
MLTNKKISRGFSLLELLVASAILSTGILVILQAAGLCARITGIVEDNINALVLSKDKLEELQYKENSSRITQPVDSGVKGKYRWEYDLNPDPGLDLYKCSFKVSWEKEGKGELLEAVTYLRK